MLNDAILAAAIALSKREKTRRKIIFVISDGRELHSTASYRDVLKVLLTNNITVYAIGVGSAALPGYGKLAKIHLPRMGYTDILPKYCERDGGLNTDRQFPRTLSKAPMPGDGRCAQSNTRWSTRLGPPISEACRDLEVTVARAGCEGVRQAELLSWAAGALTGAASPRYETPQLTKSNRRNLPVTLQPVI